MNSVFDFDASLGQDANDFAPKTEVLKSPKFSSLTHDLSIFSNYS